MKKFIFPFLLILIFSLPANGQKKNLVKTSLIFPLGEIFDLSYERVLNEEMSLVMEGIIGGDFTGVSPQFRYYLSESRIAPDGGFISPFVMIATDDMAGGGLLVGYQRLFKEIISLDVYIGPAVFTETIAVWGGINVGIAF